MTHNDLLEIADEVGRLIDRARTDLARGRAVDLSAVERKVADIYGEVSGDTYGDRDGRAALMARLDALLVQLNALEADLTARHQAMVGP